MENDAICSICHDVSTYEKPLYRHCNCISDVALMHVDCLGAWVEKSQNYHCLMCKGRYETVQLGIIWSSPFRRIIPLFNEIRSQMSELLKVYSIYFRLDICLMTALVLTIFPKCLIYFVSLLPYKTQNMKNWYLSSIVACSLGILVIIVVGFGSLLGLDTYFSGLVPEYYLHVLLFIGSLVVIGNGVRNIHHQMNWFDYRVKVKVPTESKKNV
jgi:hypothetical protein